MINVRVAPGKGLGGYLNYSVAFLLMSLPGVYATGIIDEAQEVGVYSGLMITGMESLERDG